MAFMERIAVVIDSVHKGAVRGLNETGGAAAGLQKQSLGAKGALALLDRTGLGATGTLGKLRSSIASTGSVTQGLSASGIGLGKVLGVGVAGGAVVAGTALANFALDGVQKFSAATAEVRGLKRILGGTAEDASKLRYAANRLGVDLSAVERAGGMLAKTVGMGTNKLREYGVEVVRDSNGNLNMAATIARVADAYQSTDDPAKRAAIGQAAFGRGWQALAPILGKNKEELKAIYEQAGQDNQIFNDDDLEKGRRLAAAQKELKQAIDGLQIALGEGLAPVLADFAELLSNATRTANDLLEPIGGLGEAISFTGDTFLHMIPGVGQAMDVMNLFGGSTDESSKKAEKHAAAQKRQAAATKEATAAITAETQAQLEQVGGALAYEASLRSLADARDNYNRATLEAIAAGGKDAEKNKAAADAEFSLKQAIDSTARAAASKAQQDLGPNATAADKAKASNDAYRQSLMGAANSDIPGMRNQALILIATLNDYASRSYAAKVNLDTAEAMGKLNSLKTRWDEVAGAMGPVGPQGPRVQLRK